MRGHPGLTCIVCQRQVLDTPGLYWVALNRWILGVGVARQRQEVRLDKGGGKDLYAWRNASEAAGSSAVAVCVPHCAATFLEMQCREMHAELERRCDELEDGPDSQ